MQGASRSTCAYTFEFHPWVPLDNIFHVGRCKRSKRGETVLALQNDMSTTGLDLLTPSLSVPYRQYQQKQELRKKDATDEGC